MTVTACPYSFSKKNDPIMPLDQNPHQTVTRFGCVGFSFVVDILLYGSLYNNNNNIFNKDKCYQTKPSILTDNEAHRVSLQQSSIHLHNLKDFIVWHSVQHSIETNRDYSSLFLNAALNEALYKFIYIIINFSLI